MADLIASSGDTTALVDVKERVVGAWYRFTSQHASRAIVPDWRVGQTLSGEPAVSCEVVGPGAAETLRRFATDYPHAPTAPGDVRPQLDYNTPGRTTVAWRTGGVWVQLWHPDTTAAPQTPVLRAFRRSVRPSARLPFTRSRNTLRETTA